MDGRRAAVNVLIGAAIGAVAPIVAAIALMFATDYFHPLDYFGTLAVICGLCAAVGVVVNLPWDVDPASKPFTASGRDYGFAEHANRFDPHAHAETETDEPIDGDDAQRRAADGSDSASTGRGPRGGFSISYRQALNILGVESDADLDTIRAAYRQRAKQMHPDQFASQGDQAVQQATEQFRNLQEAYALVRSEV